MNNSKYSEVYAFHKVEIDLPIMVEVYFFYLDRSGKLPVWNCLLTVRFKQKVIKDVNEVRI